MLIVRLSRLKPPHFSPNPVLLLLISLLTITPLFIIYSINTLQPLLALFPTALLPLGSILKSPTLNASDVVLNVVGALPASLFINRSFKHTELKFPT